MSKKPATISINLLPADPFYDTVLGRVLKWALTGGRYIVIFTELVVIASFATRFTLDRQLTDLNSEIQEKKTIIQSYGDLENNFVTAQAKIQEYKKIEQDSTILDSFEHLTEVSPAGVSLDELVITPTGVRIGGTSSSQNAFNLLINNLQLSPHFFNVSVDRIEAINESGSAVSFSLRADTKEVGTVATEKK